MAPPRGSEDAPSLEERWGRFARELELAAMSWSPAPMALLTLPVEAATAGRIDLVRALAGPLATMVHRRAELLDLAVVGATHAAVAAVVEVLKAAGAVVPAALAKRAAAWAPNGRARTGRGRARTGRARAPDPIGDGLPRWPAKDRGGDGA